MLTELENAQLEVIKSKVRLDLEDRSIKVESPFITDPVALGNAKTNNRGQAIAGAGRRALPSVIQARRSGGFSLPCWLLGWILTCLGLCFVLQVCSPYWGGDRQGTGAVRP